MGISTGLHVLLIFGLGWGATHPADFAMESGMGGMLGSQEFQELQVVVELESVPPEALPEPELREVIKPQVLFSESLEASKKQTLPPPKQQSAPPTSQSQKMTATGSGGVQTQAKPDYLRNPPPRYPPRAKRLKQQGVVFLNVWVSAKGRVQRLDIRKSSGFSMLDQAARESVKKWKFKPARQNRKQVDSKVIIPVRFELK
jgi:protein TonB